MLHLLALTSRAGATARDRLLLGMTRDLPARCSTMSMQMQHHEDGRAGRFCAMSGDVTAGVVTYTRIDPASIRVDHTEVFSGFERHGLGRELIAFAVDWARRHEHHISPRCPFARHVFETTPDYEDVWFR